MLDLPNITLHNQQVLPASKLHDLRGRSRVLLCMTQWGIGESRQDPPCSFMCDQQREPIIGGVRAQHQGQTQTHRSLGRSHYASQTMTLTALQTILSAVTYTLSNLSVRYLQESLLIFCSSWFLRSPFSLSWKTFPPPHACSTLQATPSLGNVIGAITGPIRIPLPASRSFSTGPNRFFLSPASFPGTA